MRPPPPGPSTGKGQERSSTHQALPPREAGLAVLRAQGRALLVLIVAKVVVSVRVRRFRRIL